MQTNNEQDIDSQTTESSLPRSAMASTAIQTLAWAKMGLGAASIIAPQLVLKLFLLDLPDDTNVMSRLFGSSCAGMGAVLWVVQRACMKGKVDVGVLRTVVGVNVLADGVDVVSCVGGHLSGRYGIEAGGMLGGGCLVLAVLGVIGLRM